ncbi:hypothetical protein LOK82_00015 [Xylella fastidiosa subsp. multiplex]|uniref:Uncharacterized protein n=1 Tax=Xylella fastidiosa subsp. multiplex TaxID=644357 RepID=A0AAW6HSM9_XYLFS|nr:hypothetical protein [Xylella fastidiosa subsp. multiplex]
MTTIMLKNTRSCDVTLDGVTIQAGRTQALEPHTWSSCGSTLDWPVV